jgi:hypothetical protein
MVKKMKINRRPSTVTSLIICLMFLISSTSAFIALPSSLQESNYSKNTSTNYVQTSADDYFIWEDEFYNAQKIDETYSAHYLVIDGHVEMDGTYPQWTDAEWTRMKEITIESQVQHDDSVIKILVEYDSDMRSDYGDLRFKYENHNYYLSYWIEEKNPLPNDPYAIVWIKLPDLPLGSSTLYMFYGNPLASDQSDYWSVFDESIWQKQYTHDHRVSYHMENEGAWDPVVSWGENSFLVTWEEGIPQYLPLGMIFKQQIRGCFYDEHGNQLGNRFDITPWNDDPFTPFRNENPASAYAESGSTKNFFIAYEYFNVPNDDLSRDIKGAIVPTSTTNIDDVTLFDICTASGNQADPQVTFDPGNNRFFVIWEDGRGGTSNYNIYGRFFDLSGNPIGSEKMLTNRPNSQVQPWITFDGVNNQYLIIWEEGIHAAHGPFEIWGQRFTLNGDPLGTPLRFSEEGTADIDYVFPCVSFCQLTERFLVTWQEADISSGEWYGHIWGKIVDKQGNAIGESFKIAHGRFERTGIVPFMSSSFFVSYDGSGEVWGRIVSAEGNVNSQPIQLSNSGTDVSEWAGIATNGENIFVAWEDHRIVSPPPYENLPLPDIFANVWSFNTPSATDISYSFSDEISIILQAHIVSTPISPANLLSWHKFTAVKQGDVTFDIVDSDNPDTILLSDLSSGASLQQIDDSSIRLKATFSRNNPSSSPILDKWAVSFVGEDDQPPVTTIKDVEGVKGLNDWYISESVIIWLHAEDYPKDTGSGIDTTYYTLNDGSPQIYDKETGIQLIVSQQSSWMGEWLVNFWSVDRSGNIETKDSEENKRFIKIDADRPYVQISTPANEERVDMPFWVKAEASDNVGIDRVEFDLSPFGEREGLPYVVTDPPYEWYCDEDQVQSLLGSTENPYPAGVNVMIRAQAFDESGQSWNHEIWVHINNWGGSDGFHNTLCYIYATGEGSIETKGITIGGITIGMVSWDFSSASNCVSAGLGGFYTTSGTHHGIATVFIGQVSTNVIAGIATSVSVTKT